MPGKKQKITPIRRLFTNMGPGIIAGAADDDPSGIATYSIAGAHVGADLSAMADAAQMFSGINSHILVVIFGTLIAIATIKFRYHQIADILKWLALTLLAYVITAFLIGPDWGSIVRDTFIPSWPKGSKTWNRNGITQIETSRQAAVALRPLAGSFATTLYAFGILGVGFLSIPTLTGSAAYAFAEVFTWNQGLDEKFNAARPFYGIIILSTMVGIILDFANINPVKALFWTAVVNGLVAPFLLLGILIVASDRKIMQKQPSSKLGLITVAVTTLIMFFAAIAMFVF